MPAARPQRVALVLPLICLITEGSAAFEPLLDCDVPLVERRRWMERALLNLTSVTGGYAAVEGSVRFAPFGTISNPSGTYGAVYFDNPEEAYPGEGDEFCSCLEGNTTVSPRCAPLEAPVYTNQEKEGACQSSYVLRRRDALVVLGCAPPVAQYFSLQTNVLAKWNSEGGLFFPEVSPLESLHDQVLNTTADPAGTAGQAGPFERAFAVISTADLEAAHLISDALVAAGLPREALNFDPLASPDLAFWGDGDDDWRASLPDTLELVFRLNGPEDRSKADRFVVESQLLRTQHAFLLRASESKLSTRGASTGPGGEGGGEGGGGGFTPFVPAWRPRSVTEAEAELLVALPPLLDLLAERVNATARAQGLGLSYYGDMVPSMDFGYVQEGVKGTPGRDDVASCCLKYPREEFFWSAGLHYATKDCLYELFGWDRSDCLYSAPDSGMLASTRFSSTAASGPVPASLDTFHALSCQAQENGTSGVFALEVRGGCEASCAQCAFTGPPAQAGLPSGCFEGTSPSGDGYFGTYACSVLGEPQLRLFSDAECAQPALTPPLDLSACARDASSVKPTQERWTGGVLRADSVVVVLGASSNSLNSSAFHNVYLPVFSAYNDPAASADLSFLEEELSGSAAPFAAGLDPAIPSHLFVAQWGRTCLRAPAAAAAAAATTTATSALEPPPLPCSVVTEDMLYINSSFGLLARHYVDPQTLTGPSKDALPRHRVLVFDRLK